MEKIAMPVSTYMLALMLFTTLSNNANLVRSVTCSEAVRTLMPCLPYLTSSTPANPTAPCCSAVDTLNREASTTQVRRDLCECFEKAATSFGVNPDRARTLPQLCGITVAVPIDPTLNCTSISYQEGKQVKARGG